HRREQLSRAVALQHASARSGLHEVGTKLIRFMHGQNQNRRAGNAPGNLTRRVQSIEPRHRDIEQENVGPHFEPELHGLTSILSFAADGPSGLCFKNGAQTLPHQSVIVGDEDAQLLHLELPSLPASFARNGSTARTVAPSGPEVILRRPPNCRTRWRIPAMPTPTRVSSAVSN